MERQSGRREFLRAGAALLAAPAIGSRVLGANDRPRLAFIGMGKMGRDNLKAALKHDTDVVAVCDVYERNLNWAHDMAKGQAKTVKDFREILSDRSIDAVCISTPDHWHAYMAVEACKAGKDVYVEKPISVSIYEAGKMVEAARKYNRVVQAGTWQRSNTHFQQAVDIVKSGELGKIAMVHTWNIANEKQTGIGNPPDTDPPPTLDWNMWLGPAPERPYNVNRFGVDPKDHYFSTFRWFWDYAGGMMTDWGVHWLDIVQMAMGEETAAAATGVGGKFWLTDDRETPDTLHVSYEYPGGYVATYENRNSNMQSMFNKGGGILFFGEKATMFVDRGEFYIVPEKNSDVKARNVKRSDDGHFNHWTNFLECMKTRQRPASDIDLCRRSTATCLLGNIAYRTKTRVTFNGTEATPGAAHEMLMREYRAPWKLEV